MKIVIGITGKLGSGKDYIANNVIIPVIEKFNYRYLQYAFADQIKVNVMTKNGISYNDVYEEKTHESRMLLQTEGTEVGRTNDPNMWVNYLSHWIHVHYKRGISVFIVSDVRFKNEHEFVKNSDVGLMLKVVAPNRNHQRLLRESDGDPVLYKKIDNHRSECDLDNLSNDILKFTKKYPNETTFNLFSEPINSSEIIKLFPNFIDKVGFCEHKIIYDFTTKFSKNGYILSKEEILTEIKEFINETIIK
jgi:hypothetical protein